MLWLFFISIFFFFLLFNNNNLFNKNNFLREIKRHERILIGKIINNYWKKCFGFVVIRRSCEKSEFSFLMEQRL